MSKTRGIAVGVIVMVQVDPLTAVALRDRVGNGSGLTAVQVQTPEQALDQLGRQDVDVDSLVLGDGVSDPVRIAQHAHQLNADVAVHMLATPDHISQLRRAVQFAPFLGEDVRCWSVNDRGSLVRALEADAGRAQLRRGHRAALAAASERMVSSVPVQTHASQMLDRLLEHAPIGIVTLDMSGEILNGNAQAWQMLGMTSGTAVGRQFVDCFESSQRDDLGQYLSLRRRGMQHEASAIFHRVEADGSEQSIELLTAPVSSRTGEPGMMALLLDVTTRVAAERQRDRAEQRLVFLADASRLLASSLDYDVTLGHVARLVISFLADWCIVYLRDADGQIRRVALEGAGTSTESVSGSIQAASAINPDASEGVPAVIRSGRSSLHSEASTSLLVADVDDPESLRPIIEPLGVTSWMCVPLTVEGRTSGAISFVSTTPGRHYSEDDLRVAEDLAQRAALAIENAHLYQAAQQAKNDARAHADRVGALAAASRAFAERSLELQPLFDAIVERIVALLGDLCIIRLLSDDRQILEPAAIAHVDPDAAEFMRTLMQRTVHGATDGMLGQVVQSGTPLLLPQLSLAESQASIKPEFHPYVERYGMYSALIVPLVGRGAILGTIGVFRDTPGRPFTSDDQSFLQDLADRAALAIENARLYHDIRDALRAREAFVSVAAHELKTPLTTIKAFGQLLERELRRVGEPHERLSALTTNLQGQINRMEVLVEDLLDASRLQQSVELRREQVNLVELARQVIERFEHDPFRTSRHTLVLDASGEFIGEWDAGRLDQVVTNLVSNALKYSPDGGEVRVSLREQGDEVELVVHDQGIGIPADEQPELFRPFARGSAPLRGIPGSGLGLYVTAQIVERHGGTIQVASQPGAGSQFAVVLPRSAGPRQRVGDDAS